MPESEYQKTAKRNFMQKHGYKTYSRHARPEWFPKLDKLLHELREKEKTDIIA